MRKRLLLSFLILFAGIMGLRAQNPEEPTEFTAKVVSNGNGGFTVQLSAKTPTQFRYSGPDIPAGTQVKMAFSRSNYSLGESDVPVNTQMVAPGTVVTCEDNDVQKGGEYTYYCYAYVDDNASWGASIYGVYIGIKPGTPTITVKVGDDGMPPVVITATAPLQTANGADLSGTMIMRIVTSGVSYGDPDIVLTTFENVAPGETKTYQYTPAELSRSYTYGVVVETPDGISDKGQNSIYVGRDLPSAPTNVQAAKNDEGTVTISWTAPTQGQRGGQFLTPVYYDVTRNDGTVVATKTEATSVIDTCEDIDRPTSVSYSVKSYNDDGGEANSTSASIIVGPPASLPFYESFGTPSGYYMKPDNLWTYDTYNWDFTDYTWAYDVDPMLGEEDGMAECYFPTYSGEPFDRYPLTSSEISLENANEPVLTFYYAPIEGAPNTISVEIIKGDQTTPVATFNVGETNGDMWKKATVSLQDFAGEKAIKLSIVPTGGEDYSKNEYVYIDEISIVDEADTTAINQVNDTLVKTVEYYNLQGVRVQNPENGTLVVRKSVKEDGTTETIKTIIRK